MARRLPLLVTLLPLLVGSAAWWVAWSQWRSQLAADLKAVAPATAFGFAGFPYRIAARTADLRLRHDDEALSLALEARSLEVNRQPFRTDRQVVSLAESRALAALRPLPAVRVAIAAPFAQASLRLEGRRIARLSGVWEQPKLDLGFLVLPVQASAFEAHLRETPAAPGAGPVPSQVQVALAGQGLRLGAGEPLRLSAGLDLLAPRPVTSLAGFRSGGRLALRDLVLADATGEVLRAEAEIRVRPGGAVEARGTIETVCPETVRQAARGERALPERRTRRPVRLSFEAILGEGLIIPPAEPGRPPPPVRGQAPPCPRLL
ncbi:hypothetical protein [Thermaurantiacus sp.]